MNIAIPETPQAGLIPLGNGLIDIRKDEREKTIKEVIEFFENGINSHPTSHREWTVLQQAKKHFAPDKLEALAEKLYYMQRKSKHPDDVWEKQPLVPQAFYLEQAKYILDNYELKKEPVDVV